MTFREYEGNKPAMLIKASLDLIHNPGDTFEVRIPKTKFGTIAGYFDDTTIAATAIAKENGKHTAIYVTVNPISKALLARSANRLEYKAETTVSDGDILRRRWFLLDFDPKRPVGISSTDGELQEARNVATTCLNWLRQEGWPEPLIADSGNGVHMMFRVDEPNDDDTRIRFQAATQLLAAMFSTDKVDVDTSVFNAARIWKIYGTVSAKGSNTDDRPHRVAMVRKLPDVWELVTNEQLESLAKTIRDAKSDEFRDMTGEFIMDMEKWLTDRGQTVVSGPRPMFGGQGMKWEISRCPFNTQHTSPVIGLTNSRPVFRCLHNSCSGYRWKEFREKIDPTYRDPNTIISRLIEWCMGESEDMDGDLANTTAATGKSLPKIMAAVRKAVPRARFLLAEEFVKVQKRRYQKEVIGENNDKGNIVGLINRTRKMQAEGVVPMYWVAEFDHRIRVGPPGEPDCPKMTQEDEIALMIKFHSLGDSWVKQTMCGQVITHLASELRTNPLKKWLEAKTWDGIPRLDTWLIDYMGTKDNEYIRAIGRKWLISAVARAMEPGCQADHMLIFEGKQGIGKSRALRILGGRFYVEYSGSFHGTAATRDMVAIITGKVIIEMSELASLRKADMETLKAMLTTPVDEARLSYERDARSYPRTCVFGGSTNAIGQAYISDNTGARRFWPAWCGEKKPVDTAGLEIVADALWGEAVTAYQNGEDWWSVPTDMVLEEQAARQLTVKDGDPWFSKVSQSVTDPDSYSNGVYEHVPEYVGGIPTGGFVVRVVSLNMILGLVLQVDTSRQSFGDISRLQSILREMGFYRSRPNKGWMGSTYAYDLRQEAAPHLWKAIEEAKKASRFKKSSAESESDEPKF